MGRFFEEKIRKGFSEFPEPEPDTCNCDYLDFEVKVKEAHIQSMQKKIEQLQERNCDQQNNSLVSQEDIKILLKEVLNERPIT